MQPSPDLPPLSRRALLYGSAMLAIGGILSACGRPSDTEPTTATPAPTRIIPLPTVAATATNVPTNRVVYTFTIAHSFDHPTHLVLDRQGNLYVFDSGNSRVQKFDRDGQFIVMWGGPGIGDGQFAFSPLSGTPAGGGIAVHPDGTIYVVDVLGRVQRFDSQGGFLGRVSDGTGATAVHATALAIDEGGTLFISDRNGNCIHLFDSAGHPRALWKHTGMGDGEFLFPVGLASDRQGRLYIADQGNARVDVFDRDGTYRARWGVAGAFVEPWGMALDSRGDVYVTDRAAGRVQRFTSDGQLVLAWGEPGMGDGQFMAPTGIAVDARMGVYIADDRRVQKFQTG